MSRWHRGRGDYAFVSSTRTWYAIARDGILASRRLPKSFRVPGAGGDAAPRLESPDPPGGPRARAPARAPR